MQRRKPMWNKKTKEWILLEAPFQAPLHAVLWNLQVKIWAFWGQGSFAFGFGVTGLPGKVTTLLSSRSCSLYKPARFLQVTTAVQGTHVPSWAEWEEWGGREVARKYVIVVKLAVFITVFVCFLS